MAALRVGLVVPLLVPLLVALVLPLVGPAASYADTARLRDPDDARGRLDLARVGHTHVQHRLEHTIRMQAGWRARVLRHGRLTVLFKSGSRYRTVELDYRRRRLVGAICRDERLAGGGLTNCSRDVGLERPDGRTVTVTLRKRQVRKPGRQGYKWQVTSFLEGGDGDCPTGTLCVDALPGGPPWIRHGLTSQPDPRKRGPAPAGRAAARRP